MTATSSIYRFDILDRLGCSDIVRQHSIKVQSHQSSVTVTFLVRGANFMLSNMLALKTALACDEIDVRADVVGDYSHYTDSYRAELKGIAVWYNTVLVPVVPTTAVPL